MILNRSILVRLKRVILYCFTKGARGTVLTLVVTYVLITTIDIDLRAAEDIVAAGH